MSTTCDKEYRQIVKEADRSR